MNILVNTKERPKISVKIQLLAALIAIVGAVAIPQVFHLIGKATGAGTAPGEIFLPMHLPIILVGLLAGPIAGAISGFLAPLCSFALSGMPLVAMLPFMMIELCFYGLSSGMLRRTKLTTGVKVLISQLAGRAARAIAILVTTNILGITQVGVISVLTAIPKGLPGILLQLILLPLIVFYIESVSNKNNEAHE